MLVVAYSFPVAAHNKTFRYSDISSNEHHTVVVWSNQQTFERESVEKWMMTMTCSDCYTDYSNEQILDIQFHYKFLYYYPAKIIMYNFWVFSKFIYIYIASCFLIIKFNHFKILQNGLAKIKKTKTFSKIKYHMWKWCIIYGHMTSIVK